MSAMGLSVPPGFTITTEVCSVFHNGNKNILEELWPEVLSSLEKVEIEMGRKFGDHERPLLVSVRSGAATSMPGMMDTILNLGLNDETVKACAATFGARFAYVSELYSCIFGCCSLILTPFDFSSGFLPAVFVHVRKCGAGYCRAKVTKSKAAALNAIHFKIFIFCIAMLLSFEEVLSEMKSSLNVTEDTDLSAEDLQQLVVKYKQVYTHHGHVFPPDPYQQLLTAITAVFDSWNCDRAIRYRQAVRSLSATSHCNALQLHCSALQLFSLLSSSPTHFHSAVFGVDDH